MSKRPAAITFPQAIADPALFDPWFSDPSWATWKVATKAMFAEPMTAGEVETFSRFTGRSIAPTAPMREGWFCCGRRAGKSVWASALATYLAAFRDYRRFLKPGERAVVQVVAGDRNQARVCFSYVAAMFDNIPLLTPMIVSRTAESLALTNGISIEVQTCSFRSIRGRTVVAAIFDEAATWHSEDSRNPDHEVLAAVRPAMATIPTSLLLVISSPYAKRGILWDAYRRFYGKDDPGVLVWKAGTVEMNSSIDRAFLDAEHAKDPASARAEYDAHFRDDLESFVSPEAVDRAVVRGRAYLPHTPGRHFAFVDPSGGSADSFTLAIARRDGGKAALVRLAEIRPPFSPDAATEELASIVNEYGLTRVMGDRYAGSWPRDRFRAHGITYETADLTKSDYFQAMLPLLNAGRIELLDHQRMIAQLLALERATSRLGKDSISHPPNGHDDLINAAAGALVSVFKHRALEGYKGLPPEKDRTSKPGALSGGDVGSVEWHACPQGHRIAVGTRSEKAELERGESCPVCHPLPRGWKFPTILLGVR